MGNDSKIFAVFREEVDDVNRIAIFSGTKRSGLLIERYFLLSSLA